MKLVIIFLFLLSGCKAPEPQMRPVCSTPADRQAHAQFIIDCAKAANPLSDEEGEDLVKQCHRSGRDVLCPQVKHCWTGDSWEACS